MTICCLARCGVAIDSVCSCHLGAGQRLAKMRQRCKAVKAAARRQAQTMFKEKHAHFKTLPLLGGMQYFYEVVRTVCETVARTKAFEHQFLVVKSSLDSKGKLRSVQELDSEAERQTRLRLRSCFLVGHCILLEW